MKALFDLPSLRGAFCERSEQEVTKQSPAGSLARRQGIASLDSSGPPFLRSASKWLLAMTVVLCVSACEQIIPADGLPYADHIVVHGVLIAGQPIDSISITHTMPLTLAYDRQGASIPDADVRVSVDGRSIQLAYIGDGYFSDTTGVVVNAGKQYSLDVQWNGLHAAASTVVPEPPVADSAKLGPRQVYYYDYGGYGLDSSVQYPLLVHVHSEGDIAFSMRDDSDVVYFDTTHRTQHYHAGEGFSYVQLPPADSSTFWLESGYQWGGTYFPIVDSIKMLTTIGSFDKAYYYFLRTSDNYRDNSPFANAGKNPQWNVHGDGIGFFVGESTAQFYLSFKP
jgi:hypothetical protein